MIMATLSPSSNRARASSTSLSSPTISVLGRRRSTSQLSTTQPTTTTTTTTTKEDSNPKKMDSFLSNLIQWLHVPQKHSFSWSTPSSPRSSSDDLVLPLSASATTVTFKIDPPPSSVLSSPQSDSWHYRLPSINVSIILVILLLPVSTLVVLWCLSTLPITMAWPHNLADLAQLGRELQGYSQSSWWALSHVAGVMAISAIWKHAWSIPGSVLWNVLAGALFSPFYATILLTTLTTVGSLCATLLAAPLGPFITTLFPRALDMTRTALNGTSDADQNGPLTQNSNSSAWVRLSVLRLIGVVPWSGINIACGVCGVSLKDCILGTFIGCLPWTAVTCQIGDILQTVASAPSPTPQTVSSLLTTPELIIKLVALSVLSLAPILGRTQLKAIISASRTMDDKERVGRWIWVQEWRTKIRISSRSRSRAEDQHRLAILVDEKRAFEDLAS
ncbi:hypothetical protein CVT24_004040 [Panaeolus cyanescens]|uniref:VTT domain-containing protein n=1 Tax=Panaeolus cyanescens TaxID=181874 RepID=A0A409Y6F3_9AGAR|nr:hypothetical protein CVT24_004040 [Panaeolus cyanescens]